MTDITIIGAGASGMMAAITAARAGKKVTIIEHMDKIGKKILATGNGKCNFTNKNMTLDYYNGSKELATSVLSKFSYEDCLNWFMELGIYPKDKNGYIYPNSETAVSVVNALEMELKRLGVEILLSEKVKDIQFSKYGYDIYLNKSKITSKKLIIACGLLANPKLGSNGEAFNHIKELGHRFTAINPALCAFNCKGLNFKTVSGVRTNARVTLVCDGKEGPSDTGELQLTDYGLSGIPVFQLSSPAAKAIYNKKNTDIKVDFFPDMNESDLLDMLLKRQEVLKDDRNIYDYLNGIFNPKLISALLEKAKLNGKDKANGLSEDEIRRLVKSIKACICKVDSPRPMDFAQVCSGGIRTDEIDIHSLESKICQDLYFCGEVLDVDGLCGGYNLQWAWSSGYVAGINASK